MLISFLMTKVMIETVVIIVIVPLASLSPPSFSPRSIMTLVVIQIILANSMNY